MQNLNQNPTHFVSKVVAMDNEKTCTKCHETKVKSEFYISIDSYLRSECKKCTIAQSVKAQKGQPRYSSKEVRSKYMRDYYSKHKEKFAKYRAEFNERYPTYYKERRDDVAQAARPDLKDLA